jgi:hypothetical protein
MLPGNDTLVCSWCCHGVQRYMRHVRRSKTIAILLFGQRWMLMRVSVSRRSVKVLLWLLFHLILVHFLGARISFGNRARAYCAPIRTKPAAPIIRRKLWIKRTSASDCEWYSHKNFRWNKN